MEDFLHEKNIKLKTNNSLQNWCINDFIFNN